jgi:hypothetical protein
LRLSDGGLQVAPHEQVEIGEVAQIRIDFQVAEFAAVARIYGIAIRACLDCVGDPQVVLLLVVELTGEIAGELNF